MAWEGERMAAPFFRFVKQTHLRAWFSDASFEAVRGMCLETRVYWAYSLSEEERKRTIRRRKGGDGIRLSINVQELMGMVMTAYVMIVIRRDTLTKERESVLIWGESSLAVQWVLSCGWGKGEERSGGDDEEYGGVGEDRSVELPGKVRAGRGECSGGWDNEVEGK